jgi:hypothetical protein
VKIRQKAVQMKKMLPSEMKVDTFKSGGIRAEGEKFA